MRCDARKRALCAQISSIGAELRASPCCASARRALRFVEGEGADVLAQFGGCGWKYVCTPENPPVFWSVCLTRLKRALRALLSARLPPLGGALNCEGADPYTDWRWLAVWQAWESFAAAVKDVCASVATDGELREKWVVRHTLPGPPFEGRTLSVPTTQPLLGERQFASRNAADFALYRSPPGTSVYQNETKCNSFGCWQVINASSSVSPEVAYQRRRSRELAGVASARFQEYGGMAAPAPGVFGPAYTGLPSFSSVTW